MSLTAARQRLADALAGMPGVEVHPYLPEAPSGAVMAIIQAGSPYITSEEEVFGHHRVRFDILLATRSVSNAATLRALDDHIAALIDVLGGEFVVEEVGEPYLFQSADVLYLAADVTTTTTIEL